MVQQKTITIVCNATKEDLSDVDLMCGGDGEIWCWCDDCEFGEIEEGDVEEIDE